MTWKRYPADCPFPSSPLRQNSPQLTYFVNFLVEKKNFKQKYPRCCIEQCKTVTHLIPPPLLPVREKRPNSHTSSMNNSGIFEFVKKCFILGNEKRFLNIKFTIMKVDTYKFFGQLLRTNHHIDRAQYTAGMLHCTCRYACDCREVYNHILPELSMRLE